MTAGEWIYGGFWLSMGIVLAYCTAWCGLFFVFYLYGFLKGLFS